MMEKIFVTRANEHGKPLIVALMFSESLGVALPGGNLAPGASLTFGEQQPFRPEDWREITQDEYEARYGLNNTWLDH